MRIVWAALGLMGCVHDAASNAGDGGAGGAHAAGGSGGTASSVTSAVASGTGGAAGPGCGDGDLAQGEECDDGNKVNQDGCDAGCRVECAVGFLDPLTHHCYVLISTSVSQQDALNGCMTLAPGYDLAGISSQAEHDFLITKLPTVVTTVWIGANDQMTEGSFVWHNGERWGFTQWEPMEPNDAMANEDCVTLRNVYMAYMWNDLDCAATTTTGFLCELTPAGSMP